MTETLELKKEDTQESAVNKPTQKDIDDDRAAIFEGADQLRITTNLFLGAKALKGAQSDA